MRNTYSAPIPDFTWTDDYYECRQRGRAEYDDGFAIDDNPFDPNEQPITHRGWRDGWMDAQERAYGR